MRDERQYTEIHAVVQRAPYSCTEKWYAGVGAQGIKGTAVFSYGSFLESEHSTIQEAKATALAYAKAFRNTVLTLGGCTFETLPPITFEIVGIDLAFEYDDLTNEYQPIHSAYGETT